MNKVKTLYELKNIYDVRLEYWIIKILSNIWFIAGFLKIKGKNIWIQLWVYD